MFKMLYTSLTLYAVSVFRMIIIIMDGSCIAQIFPSRKLHALAHIIHGNIHTDINIIYPPTHTHTHTMVRSLLLGEDEGTHTTIKLSKVTKQTNARIKCLC